MRRSYSKVVPPRGGVKQRRGTSRQEQGLGLATVVIAFLLFATYRFLQSTSKMSVPHNVDDAGTVAVSVAGPPPEPAYDMVAAAKICRLNALLNPPTRKGSARETFFNALGLNHKQSPFRQQDAIRRPGGLNHGIAMGRIRQAWLIKTGAAYNGVADMSGSRENRRESTQDSSRGRDGNSEDSEVWGQDDDGGGGAADQKQLVPMAELTRTLRLRARDQSAMARDLYAEIAEALTDDAARGLYLSILVPRATDANGVKWWTMFRDGTSGQPAVDIFCRATGLDPT